jgi:hypothetical protein
MAEGLASGTRTMSKVTIAWKDTPKEREADMTDARKFSQSSSVASFCLVSPDMYGPYLPTLHTTNAWRRGGGGAAQRVHLEREATRHVLGRHQVPPLLGADVVHLAEQVRGVVEALLRPAVQVLHVSAKRQASRDKAAQGSVPVHARKQELQDAGDEAGVVLGAHERVCFTRA